MRLECVCHDTLPRLISVSLGETGTVRRMTTQKIAGSTVHKLPADFRKAIESNAAAKSVWTDITPLARNEWICWVTSAKKEETRKRRSASISCAEACAGRAVGPDARTAEGLPPPFVPAELQ
jgi:hypothetical protein